MRSFFEEYHGIIGVLLLTIVIILLFSTPSMIFAKSFTTIGTELSRASSDELLVRAKIDFGSNEHMRAFPKQIGNWWGTDYDTAGLAKMLGADVLLMRAYSNPDFYQPVFFLIMQSNTPSSFHPPVVCYPALGYTIVEEGRDEISVQDVNWIEEQLYSRPLNKTLISANRTISVKKLVVVKESPDSTVTERRVVLYYYVKEKPVSSTITMVRISAIAPLDGSYNATLKICKAFMAETIPCMFEPQKKESALFSIILASAPGAGTVTIILLFIVPLAIIFYHPPGRWRRTYVYHRRGLKIERRKKK
ncbi:MAG: exosortase-associated EpsI family protein [Halobacteriota archaeon]